MIFEELEIAGLFRVDMQPHRDGRGFFGRVFCRDEMKEAGLSTEVVQINNSLTSLAGALRGLHFQRSPKAENKFVRCVRGAVFDVAVDLRDGSPTFGNWASLPLTEENRTMIYIPQGFAHGFQTLKPDTELIYLHTESYSPEHEDAVNPLDPSLDITWPLDITNMSDRDRQHPSLEETEPVVL